MITQIQKKHRAHLYKLGMFNYRPVTVPKAHQTLIFGAIDDFAKNKFVIRKYYYNGRSLSLVLFSLNPMRFGIKDVFVIHNLKDVVSSEVFNNAHSVIHKQWLRKISLRNFREG